MAMTAALNGALIQSSTILIAGVAFSVAGGVSMFFSNYLSRKSEIDALKMDVDRERMEIETEPEEERSELVELLSKEGYTEAEVNVIMSRVMKDKEMWLRAQLMHELKLHVDDLETDPLGRSASAGAAFMLAAFIALAPYATGVALSQALVGSIALSVLTLFVLGSKAFTLKAFSLRGGMESAILGVVAAVSLYLIGHLISLL